MYTLQERQNFINDMLSHISELYDLSNVQLFVFGSFLTDDFTPNKSDIDIGVYCDDETKMYNIQYDLKLYFDSYNLKSDIVIMNLHDKLLINVPILLYGTQLTEYEDTKLFDYLVHMIKNHNLDTTNLILQGV